MNVLLSIENNYNCKKNQWERRENKLRLRWWNLKRFQRDPRGRSWVGKTRVKYRTKRLILKFSGTKRRFLSLARAALTTGRKSSFLCTPLVVWIVFFGFTSILIPSALWCVGTVIWCWIWFLSCHTVRRITRLSRRLLKAPLWMSWLSYGVALLVCFLRWFFLLVLVITLVCYFLNWVYRKITYFLISSKPLLKWRQSMHPMYIGGVLG